MRPAGQLLRVIVVLSSLSILLFGLESTNIQYLYSDGFRGDTFVYDTQDGKKSTITFEHYRTWSLGDLYMFIDLTDGQKSDDSSFDAYSEISPRFSLTKMTGSCIEYSVFKEFYVAAQLNQGYDYQAWLVGLGTDIDVPGFEYVNLNVYHKSSNIETATYQMSSAYRTIGLLRFHIEGYFDLTPRDLNTQNQLLWDAGTSFGRADTFFVGTEWLFYAKDHDGQQVSTNVWQLMMKYRF